MTNIYTSVEDVPIMMNAQDIAAVLGISRANAYNLMHTRGFPTLHIGKRMVVPKEKLLAWINENSKPRE